MIRFGGWAVRLPGRLAFACCALLGAGCATAPDPLVPAAEVERSEAALLAPFQTERVVVCDRLEVVLTANFYDELILPALITGVQDEQRGAREDGGTEVVYRSRVPQSPLRLGIGRTQALVLREARIVVLGGRSEFRLDAEFATADAAAPVSVVEGDQRYDVREFRIAAGALQRR